MATSADTTEPEPSWVDRRRLRKATKRSVFWRWRRFFFLLMLLGVAAMAGVWLVLSSIALPDRDTRLAETTFVIPDGDTIATLDVSGCAPPMPSIWRGSGVPMIRRSRSLRSAVASGRSPRRK